MLVIALLSGFTCFSSTAAQLQSKETAKQVIYLVRHAEKQSARKDPELTECGLLRAQSIAKQLELITLDTVYSTGTKRTMQTALPTASSKNITINKYDATLLNDFAQQLLKKNQTILVVGHSNTTAVLAGLLIGEEFTSFDESIYDRLYQVVIIAGQAQLQILQQNFQCKG